jgi:hypothetical protein
MAMEEIFQESESLEETLKEELEKKSKLVRKAKLLVKIYKKFKDFFFLLLLSKICLEFRWGNKEMDYQRDRLI